MSDKQDFGEPWVLNASAYWDTEPVLGFSMQDGIVRAALDENEHPMVAVKGDQQAKYWSRIVACVNACEGIETEDLEDKSRVVVLGYLAK